MIAGVCVSTNSLYHSPTSSDSFICQLVAFTRSHCDLQRSPPSSRSRLCGLHRLRHISDRHVSLIWFNAWIIGYLDMPIVNLPRVEECLRLDDWDVLYRWYMLLRIFIYLLCPLLAAATQATPITTPATICLTKDSFISRTSSSAFRRCSSSL